MGGLIDWWERIFHIFQVVFTFRLLYKGGTLGGIIGTLPTTIVPYSIGVAVQLQPKSVSESLFTVPTGMYVLLHSHGRDCCLSSSYSCYLGGGLMQNGNQHELVALALSAAQAAASFLQHKTVPNGTQITAFKHPQMHPSLILCSLFSFFLLHNTSNMSCWSHHGSGADLLVSMGTRSECILCDHQGIEAAQRWHAFHRVLLLCRTRFGKVDNSPLSLSLSLSLAHGTPSPRHLASLCPIIIIIIISLSLSRPSSYPWMPLL